MFKLLKSSEKTNRSARAADAVHTLALHSITASTAPSTTEEEERAMVLLFQIELMGVDVVLLPANDLSEYFASTSVCTCKMADFAATSPELYLDLFDNHILTRSHNNLKPAEAEAAVNHPQSQLQLHRLYPPLLPEFLQLR